MRSEPEGASGKIKVGLSPAQFSYNSASAASIFCGVIPMRFTTFAAKLKKMYYFLQLPAFEIPDGW
jgi:hypothetical protein